MSMKASETAVRAFFETLNTGDLEALRPLVKRATWKPMVKNLTSADSYSGDAIIAEPRKTQGQSDRGDLHAA